MRQNEYDRREQKLRLVYLFQVSKKVYIFDQCCGEIYTYFRFKDQLSMTQNLPDTLLN